MLDGRRPHPWIGHAKLQSLGNRRTPGWVFSPSTTTSTLEWVAKQDEDLAAELDELLHFGDIVSWSSLNEAIYTTVYGTGSLARPMACVCRWRPVWWTRCRRRVPASAPVLALMVLQRGTVRGRSMPATLARAWWQQLWRLAGVWGTSSTSS